MAHPSERRNQQRNEIRWRVSVEAPHGSVEGETRNVSMEGILVCCEEPLQLHEIYRMSILPPEHPAIGVTGKVVWSDVYGIDDKNSVFGMGVCLLEVTDQDRRIMEEALSKESSR